MIYNLWLKNTVFNSTTEYYKQIAGFYHGKLYQDSIYLQTSTLREVWLS